MTGCDPMESEIMQDPTFVELLKIFGYKPMEEPTEQEEETAQWILPCEYGRVSSPFGYRYHPITGEWKGHTGVDLTRPRWAVETGKPVPIYASRSGKVVFAGSGEISGNYVTIDHGDGFRSQYLHLDKFVVEEGQEVPQGHIIGYMGDTGVVTGPHLHFTIRQYDAETKKWEPVDPTLYLYFPSENK